MAKQKNRLSLSAYRRIYNRKRNIAFITIIFVSIFTLVLSTNFQKDIFKPAQAVSSANITSISTSTGPTSGGTTVNIAGSNFVKELNFSSISAGYGHTCALANSQVYCWGLNANSQLGNGTSTNSSTPVLV